ncbi:MAG: ABC-2 family transporter protein [Archangiaceae bacterium]|nr:ABC-2 family transporter protein [Archangiaceae bacterium]
MNSPGALLRFFTATLKANAQSALEYRASLISQAVGMFISNGMWLVFFSAYFGRFALPGVGLDQLVCVWAFASGAFGLAGVLFGNAGQLAGVITRGELDVYLALPKPVLLHVVSSRMRLVSVGDVVFAFISFALIRPTLLDWLLYLGCIACGAVVVVSFYVLTGSLAFWLGAADNGATQLNNALANFSTYPSPIFRGASRVLVHFVIPAGFVVGVPTELLRAPAWQLALEEVGAAAVLVALAVAVFHLGLKRYTSGNLIAMRE